MTSSGMPSSSSLSLHDRLLLFLHQQQNRAFGVKLWLLKNKLQKLNRKLDINVNHFRGKRRDTVELRRISLVESAGEFPVHCQIHFDLYFESAYVPINVTFLCLWKGQRRRSTDCLQTRGA